MSSDQVRLAPSVDEAYRPFIVTSLVLGIFLGFALGLHTAVSRLTGGGSADRAADLVRAHGQVQLLGFAGLYVMGMSLRLLPRFSGSRLAFPSLLTPMLVLLVLGLVLRAVVLPFLSGGAHDVLLLAIAVLVLAANILFAAMIYRTARQARELDASVVAFALGTLFSLSAALMFLLTAADAVSQNERTVPLLADNALLQIELDGFVLCFIAGVAMRAVPTLVGMQRPSLGVGLALMGLITLAVAVLALSLLYLEYGSYSAALARISSVSFAAFGVALLALSWMSGALRSAGNRLRPASQPHLALVRSAFAWMAVAGAIAVYAGVKGVIDGSIPAQFLFDAVRHSLGVGVITNLIAGMSLMIVPEFAAQRREVNQAPIARLLFVLINLAVIFRVAPALAGTAWSFDLRNASMALAGTLAEAALIIFAVELIRLVLRPQSPRRFA